MQSTKKQFNRIADNQPLDTHRARKTPEAPNRPADYMGQMEGNGDPEKFAKPMQEISARIDGIEQLFDDIGEKSGFITTGYLDKQGTAYGEAAKFNFLPPGMNISNQENAEFNDMPLRRLVAESYPGDGWMPTPRDVAE